MHSVDVASANQGPLSLNPLSWREGMERRGGGVIDLKGLWHFWARLFLIRATCFIHNPVCALLLSKHAPHLLTSRQCSGPIRLLMWELWFGFWGWKTFGGDKTVCRLELLPAAGVLSHCLVTWSQGFRYRQPWETMRGGMILLPASFRYSYSQAKDLISLI